MERQAVPARLRRVTGTGFAVVALSFLLLFVPILLYAFVLAFQVRGVPDQAAINHFAATISPAAMPWLERVLTLLLAFRMVRRTESARAVDGLGVGILAGLLGIGVSLAFGGRLTLASLLSLLVHAGLGWLGGLVARKWPPKA
jgi:dolichol kinase